MFRAAPSGSTQRLLGRGQVVRQRFLVSRFAGSIPAAPAIIFRADMTANAPFRLNTDSSQRNNGL